MKKLLFGFVLLFSQLNLMAQKSDNYIQFVNPLIGTEKMGHTFPGAPASDQYQLGSPAIKNVVLKLENGKTLTIEARDQSDKNVYVEKVTVNGREIKRNSLRRRK